MKYLRTFLPLFVTLVLVCMPLMAFAITAPGADPSAGFTAPGANPSGNFTAPGANPCTGNNCSLENPLQVGNFCKLLKVILDALIVIGLPIAVVFLIIVGFKFILAQGNQEKLSTARSNFLHTVLGIAIFLGAWTIVKVLTATLAGLGVGGINQC